MSEEVRDYVGRAIDEAHPGLPAATRRQMITGAGATLAGMGLMGALPSLASASTRRDNSTKNILTVAATAEVLATIVNTIGYRRHLGGDAVTQRNIAAAAREELVHYNVLHSVGARPATKKIWVPDAVFANRTNFLSTLEVGDQIFVNAYLIGTEAFAHRGQSQLAITAAQFMGVEGVHRALARQSLGLLGNDRVFMKEETKETAPGAPNRGQPGFEHILTAVAQLEAAGFGFGTKGATPGRFYDFNDVRKRTPNDPDLNTFVPDLVTG
jgi:hypothetical protein